MTISQIDLITRLADNRDFTRTHTCSITRLRLIFSRETNNYIKK